MTISTITDAVRLFLNTECFPEEIDAFREALKAVEDEPFENSMPWLGRGNTPHLMRYFRFGGCRAFFTYTYVNHETVDMVVTVIACKRNKPIRRA